MKKYLPSLVISISLIILNSGCRKNDSSQSIRNNLILLTQAYMNAQRNISSNNVSFIDTLLQTVNWAGLTSASISNLESCIYIPLTYNSNSTGLVFLLNNTSNTIEMGYLLEISGTTQTPDPIGILTDFYSYNKNNFTGQLANYTFSNSMKWEMGYSRGKNTYRKAVMNSGMVPPSTYANKVVNKSSIPSTIANSPENCLDWYLVEYYDDGSEDWTYIGTTCTAACTSIIQISKGNGSSRITNSVSEITLNCGGGGSGGVEPEPAVDTIGEALTTPCYVSVFNTLTSSGLTNDLSNLITNTFGCNDTVNLTYLEAPSVYGDSTATASTKPNGGTGFLNLDITLSESQLAGASQEYIAETMFHEAIHAFLDATQGVTNPLNQHLQMIQSYVNVELAALTEIFPNLTPTNGECLIFGGMQDVVENNPAMFSSAIASYNLSQATITSINNQFKTGTLGTPCPTNNGGGQNPQK